MNLNELNYSLFKSAEHLAEAGKFMMILDKERGVNMLDEAMMILSIIKPEEDKVSEERLSEVMSEILSFTLEK